MGKIVKTIIFIFLFSVSLFSNSVYLSEVNNYSKKINTASEDETLKIFHALQNIYIKSIINEDKELKKETLKNLVKSAKILKLDYSNYEKELILLDSKYTSHKKIDKNIPKKIKKDKKSYILRLKNLKYYNDHIVLYFNQNIEKNDIKTFLLKSRKWYKKVYDFKAILDKKFKISSKYSFLKIRLAQFNTDTVRLVFISEKSIKYNFSVKKREVSIYFKKPKSINVKRTKKEKISYSYFNPRSKVIVLDPGHGGKDSGAVGYSKKLEKKAVLNIALKLARELKKRGYRVYLTRTRDRFVKLRDRTRYANRKKADLFVSIHANAAPTKSKYITNKGIETFFLSRARSKRSKRVAALENRSDIEEMNYFSKKTFLDVLNREKIIQANKMALDVQDGILKSLRKRYKVVDGGVREAPFWVLVGAQMPAILVEVGYITNPVEEKRLFNTHYQTLLAKGIADGIDSYFIKN